MKACKHWGVVRIDDRRTSVYADVCRRDEAGLKIPADALRVRREIVTGTDPRDAMRAIRRQLKAA